MQLLIFDHGQLGASVKHAHIHIVPFDNAIIDRAKTLTPNLDWTKCESTFFDNLYHSDHSEDHVLMQDTDGQLWRSLPQFDCPQLFRMATALALSDWQKFTFRDVATQTFEILTRYVK